MKGSETNQRLNTPMMNGLHKHTFASVFTEQIVPVKCPYVIKTFPEKNFCSWWGSIDKATEVFEACGYHPNICIKMLEQKALLTIVDGKFDMHDLIQEMGHNIVRGEHPNNPEKHSRVWKDEEIKNIFHWDATMENYTIEAIQYDGDPSLFCKIVSNMKRLRWLSLTKPINYNVQNVETPSFLSNELCYIHLEYYPKSPFPDSFQPMKLATLKLVYSLQKNLWNGCKRLPHLQVLELFKMKNLLSTPDFDGLPCLQKLTLKQCKREWLSKITLCFSDLKALKLQRGLHLLLEGEDIDNLPENWRIDFCGFLMCVVMEDYASEVYTSHSISMKPVISGMDSEDDVVWQESDGGEHTWVFYVSFASLRHTPWWSSNYKAISIHNTQRDLNGETTCTGFGVALVARESGSGPAKTISTKQEESEFSHYTPKFEISHDSEALQISFPNEDLDQIEYFLNNNFISRLVVKIVKKDKFKFKLLI
ncbi:hypothetical protein L1987_53528 [Smallanthus sonchifolius]|uniref:Uncharacterized protein n=1 Tax=Smallanthus sonchifolius TaxID=185202 RepID=A0ACB9EWS5_9ASTR|nr:hypothetical protein L1987_53528 [Smallanthus sonchifolius]